MADETVEKVFSIDKGEYIDKPVEVDNNADQPIVTDDKTDTTDAKVDAAATTTPLVKTDVKVDDKTKTDLPSTTFVLGEYIKGKFSERFGIESEEDLEEILTAQDKLVDQFEELKKKASEPVYRTDQEKRVAEFLKDYDPSKFGEGLTTAAAIMGMDPENVNGKVAMQEKFILEHPHLTRDEAKDWFEDDYKKYVVDKEKFDDDASFEKQKRIADIRLKDEETRARNFLKDQKQKLKSVEKPVETKTDTKFELDKPTVDNYTNEVEKFTSTFDKIQFKSEDQKDVLFNIVLDKDKQKDIKNFMMRHVNNPNAYGDDKKIANFTAPTLAKQALRILHGDWLEAQMMKEIKTLARTLKAEQIAEQSVQNKDNGGSAGGIKRSQTDQFEELGKKQAESRKR